MRKGRKFANFMKWRCGALAGMSTLALPPVPAKIHLPVRSLLFLLE